MTPAASIWAAAQSGAEPGRDQRRDPARTRSSPVPTATSSVRVLPPLGYDFALRLRDGATLIEAAQALERPRLRSRDPSRRIGRVRRRRLHPARRAVMIADAARASALAPIEPDRPRHQRRLRPRPGVAAAARPAARAGAAVLRFGAHALGRLVHALLRREDPVLGGLQAPHLRLRDPVSRARTGGDDGEHGRNRAADPARVRFPHPLGGARPSRA